MKQWIIVSLMALTLASCSSEYQQSNALGNGYSDKKIADDSYLVTYKGNQLTAKSKANDFLMLHAAELAVQNGYKYFSLDTTDASTKYLDIYGKQIGDILFLSGVNSQAPQFVAVAKFYHQMPEFSVATMNYAYDAAQMIEKIKRQYELR